MPKKNMKLKHKTQSHQFRTLDQEVEENYKIEVKMMKVHLTGAKYKKPR